MPVSGTGSSTKTMGTCDEHPGRALPFRVDGESDRGNQVADLEAMQPTGCANTSKRRLTRSMSAKTGGKLAISQMVA